MAKEAMSSTNICDESVFMSIKPTKIKNSPIKLQVPGNPMFAIVAIKNTIEKTGMVCTSPPKYLSNLV